MALFQIHATTENVSLFSMYAAFDNTSPPLSRSFEYAQVYPNERLPWSYVFFELNNPAVFF